MIGNHPAPPTAPCPGCGESVRLRVADAYALLYAAEQRSPILEAAARILEAAVRLPIYRSRPAQVAQALIDGLPALSSYLSNELLAAARHRLDDEGRDPA